MKTTTILVSTMLYSLDLTTERTSSNKHVVTLRSTDDKLTVYLDDAALDRLIAGLQDARTTPLLQPDATLGDYISRKQAALGLDENGCERN